MIWLKEMLLLSILLVPPMVMQSLVECARSWFFGNPSQKA
jgi:hypothetical protein